MSFVISFPPLLSCSLAGQVEDLRNASPATVSRAGQIYVSDSVLGWMHVLKSKLQEVSTSEKYADDAMRPTKDECELIEKLFGEQLDALMHFIKKVSERLGARQDLSCCGLISDAASCFFGPQFPPSFSRLRERAALTPSHGLSPLQNCTPVMNVVNINQVSTCLSLMLQMIRNSRGKTRHSCSPKFITSMFIFAMMWSFGGSYFGHGPSSPQMYLHSALLAAPVFAPHLPPSCRPPGA